MDKAILASLTDDMVWSYSRVKAFEDCPYRWFLKYIHPRLIVQQVFDGKPPSKVDVDMAYIREDIDKEDARVLYKYLGVERKEMFFASYGTFVHKLIEFFLKGQKTADELVDMYLLGFRQGVKGAAPSDKVFQSYFKSGLRYLRTINPFPFNTVGVEEKVGLTISGLPFIGYIDFIGEKDGAFHVVDNKSRTLKPRSKRKTPTKSDRELDDYLRQLYLYSAAVKDKYGEFPKTLCFNCFRSGLFIKEQFDEQAYKEANDWFVKSVDRIKREEVFPPNIDFFKCKYLCELNDCCGFYLGR